MNPPTVVAHRDVAPGVDQLVAWLQLPGLGNLPVNAFLLRAREPVLVDAGVVSLQASTLAALESLIDPGQLRWIYLTHCDNDHVGCLDALLRRAPRARVVTTYVGMAKLGLLLDVPPERFRLLNPGQSLDAGDRRLLAVRPPTFDAPETTMLWDPVGRTLFSADGFGALLPGPVGSAGEVPVDVLRDGMTRWLSVDSPWLHALRPGALAEATREVAALRPEVVLSAHLAPAQGMVDVLIENVLQAPAVPPFVGPDQAELERLLGAVG
jgi:glyoxylase-like metal-dependent hydrolase (beta-lactamase superfamily II)